MKTVLITKDDVLTENIPEDWEYELVVDGGVA